MSKQANAMNQKGKKKKHQYQMYLKHLKHLKQCRQQRLSELHQKSCQENTEYCVRLWPEKGHRVSQQGNVERLDGDPYSGSDLASFL
jgi:hypothetical protein